MFLFELRVCVCGHVLQSTDAHRDRKRVSYPLELELQAIVSHLVWVQGTELESFAGAVAALNF